MAAPERQCWMPLLLLACPVLIPGIRVDGDEYALTEEPTFEWNKERGGSNDVQCGGAMKVDRVPVPWETMNSRVHKANSESDCRACAKDLMRRDILQDGWRCRRDGWDFFGRFNIYRKADVALGPKTPLHTFNLTEANLTGEPLPLPPATSPLPSALRGIFWLADQGDKSALLTFAHNSGVDCKWCSTGKLIGNSYRIRVQGNCTWAFASPDGFWTSAYAYARNMRLIYDFIFDDADNPTYAHIDAIVTRIPWNIDGWWAKRRRWLLHFNMRLESPETSAELGYPGSVTWRRRSNWFHTFSFIPYHLVQVVDENGTRIEPAWSKFVAYQESRARPGLLYHHGCQ